MTTVPAARRRSIRVGHDESPQLRLSVTHPTPAATVIAIAGELDVVTAPRLDTVLTSRLAGAAHTLVVDLSAVSFLGAAGLAVLVEAGQRADSTGQRLRLITGPHCVNRVLQITGLDAELACHPAAAF